MQAVGEADLAIVGGLVSTESWTERVSVLVNGGKISGLLDPEEPVHATNVIDASGNAVIPGGVDPHCHIGQPLGGYEMCDDFASGTLSALAGGTTSIVDFALPPSEDVDPLEILGERLFQAKAHARCDYGFHGCITRVVEDVEETVNCMIDVGVRTVKVFTTYKNELMVDDRIIKDVMVALKRHSGLTYVHAEDNSCIEAAQEDAVYSGDISAARLPDTRPESCEDRQVARVIGVARDVQAPVYFVHQSTAAAVDEAIAARRSGVQVYSETCPHYLALDSSLYSGPSPERWACCPPLRPRATVDALLRRVQGGFLHTLGSDHCCYSTSQKLLRADDVRRMPNGLPGVETRLPVAYSTLVASGLVSIGEFVAMFASAPARLNGIYPRKGTIAPGSDADIVVLDAAQERKVEVESLHMASDYSPYEGLSLYGWPTHVFLRGVHVVDNGTVLDPGPIGAKLDATNIVL